MKMLFRILISSMLLKPLFTSLTVNGSLKLDKNLSYHTEIFLSAAIKINVDLFTQTLFLIAEASKGCPKKT